MTESASPEDRTQPASEADIGLPADVEAGLLLLQNLVVRELVQELGPQAAHRVGQRIRQKLADMAGVVTFEEIEDELASAGLVHMLRVIDRGSY